MDLQTARSYRDDDRLPSERRQPRVYRTRIDPFVDVWDDVQKVLEAEPRLRAKTLFEDLQRKFPGHFEWGHFEWCQPWAFRMVPAIICDSSIDGVRKRERFWRVCSWQWTSDGSR